MPMNQTRCIEAQNNLLRNITSAAVTDPKAHWQPGVLQWWSQSQVVKHQGLQEDEVGTQTGHRQQKDIAWQSGVRPWWEQHQQEVLVQMAIVQMVASDDFDDYMMWVAQTPNVPDTSQDDSYLAAQKLYQLVNDSRLLSQWGAHHLVSRVVEMDGDYFGSCQEMEEGLLRLVVCGHFRIAIVDVSVVPGCDCRWSSQRGW